MLMEVKAIISVPVNRKVCEDDTNSYTSMTSLIVLDIRTNFNESQFY